MDLFNGSQLMNHDTSGAIFKLSLSIQILNSRRIEGAKYVRFFNWSRLKPLTMYLSFFLRYILCKMLICEFLRPMFASFLWATFISLFLSANQKPNGLPSNEKAWLKMRPNLGRNTGNVSTQNINTETNIKIVLK